MRLQGTAGNPAGIGAVVRLRFGERYGPAREVHAGSGFWSQNSATLVLATPATPTAVWVRWPGGSQRAWAWPAGARRLEIATEGVQAR